MVNRNVSFFSMISYSRHKADAELFEPVYEFLSSFAHSGTRHIFRNFSPTTYGFSVLGEDDEEQAEIGFRFMVGILVAIVLQKLHDQKMAPKVSKRDIEYYCYVVKSMAGNSSVSDGDHLLKNERQAFDLMLKRMKSLPRRRNFH